MQGHKGYMYMLFTTAVFGMANDWKQSPCPSVGDRWNIFWHFYKAKLNSLLRERSSFILIDKEKPPFSIERQKKCKITVTLLFNLCERKGEGCMIQMCLNMIRKCLNNKEIIYSVYFWEVGNGGKDQYIAEKEICVFISFCSEFIFTKSTYCWFYISLIKDGVLHILTSFHIVVPNNRLVCNNQWGDVSQIIYF